MAVHPLMPGNANLAGSPHGDPFGGAGLQGDNDVLSTDKVIEHEAKSHSSLLLWGNRELVQVSKVDTKYGLLLALYENP